nr:class I SAM-dependent methyltransferase [uncultured Actinotalea sp.]
MPTYDATFDVEADNNSHALMVHLVGADRRVLDVGCATGYLGAALKERGCTVSGVEIDPEAAVRAREVLDEVVVADLASVRLTEHFEPGSFDVVVLGDVLEHLTDPLRLLRDARDVLVPGGSVVISLPNVSHADVRLALLQGRWRYGDRGLLDRTHVVFFTVDSLLRLLAAAGLVAVDLRRTTTPPLTTEVEVDPGSLPEGVLEWVSAQPEATTYQFVLRAVVDDADGRVLAVAAERDALRSTVRDLRVQVGRLEERLAEVTRLEEDLARVRAERGAAAAELDALRSTKTMRLLERPRRAYGRVGRLLGRDGRH